MWPAQSDYPIKSQTLPRLTHSYPIRRTDEWSVSSAGAGSFDRIQLADIYKIEKTHDRARPARALETLAYRAAATAVCEAESWFGSA